MGVSRGDASASRRWVALGAKIALAAALLFWLWREGRLNVSVLLGAASAPDAGPLVVVGALAVLGGQFLLASRLRLLLRALGLPISFGRALGLTMIGSLFGTILPGLISGDAVRAAYLMAESRGSRSRALAAVLVDRVLGLYSLFLLGSLALLGAAAAGAVPADLPVPYAAPIGVGLFTAFLALLSWLRPSRLSRGGRWVGWLSAELGRLTDALGSCVRRPGLLARAIALSLANHALVIVTYVVAGRLLSAKLAVTTHLIVDPLAMVLNAVSLTPGGVGFAEGAFAYLFEGLGSDRGAAVGLLGRLIQSLTYTVGGVLALLAVRVGRSASPSS